jgi:hypothetical protein
VRYSVPTQSITSVVQVKDGFNSVNCLSERKDLARKQSLNEKIYKSDYKTTIILKPLEINNQIRVDLENYDSRFKQD